MKKEGKFKSIFKKRERIDDNPIEFEKGDLAAILIAAFTTIVPVVMLLLGLFYFVLWLIFLR